MPRHRPYNDKSRADRPRRDRPPQRTERVAVLPSGDRAPSAHLIYGLHPVLEALRAGRRPVRALLLARDLGDPALAPLLALAREKGTPVAATTRDALERRLPGAVHQGILAEAGGYPFVPLADLDEDPVIVILDGVEDPHNFGAIVRAGVGLGVTGFVIAEHRSAPLSPAALKASAGALEHARVAKVSGIPQALTHCKAGGRWLFGLAAGGDLPVDKLREYRPLGIIAGAEGSGLHRLVQERADGLTAIPMAGPLDSLNAATAAAIAIYAATRKDGV
jgi:23S rRNA (guanosine2251-2'-O)-methyltransferase